jgi:hypothetical protein
MRDEKRSWKRYRLKESSRKKTVGTCLVPRASPNQVLSVVSTTGRSIWTTPPLLNRTCNRCLLVLDSPVGSPFSPALMDRSGLAALGLPPSPRVDGCHVPSRFGFPGPLSAPSLPFPALPGGCLLCVFFVLVLFSFNLGEVFTVEASAWEPRGPRFHPPLAPALGLA